MEGGHGEGSEGDLEANLPEGLADQWLLHPGEGFDPASSLGISADSLREARPPQEGQGQREAVGGAGSCKLRV